MKHHLFGYADSALTINLDAIAANWRYINSLSGPETKTAAIVKANGYGLGSRAVAEVLARAGCELFFVASLNEAVDLRASFQQKDHDDLPIMVLHGIQQGQELDFISHQLVPVLNDLEQISRWQLYAKKVGKALPALLHFDTGMTRLGLENDQVDWLIHNRQSLEGLNIAYVMSHLVSGEIADDPINANQLATFRKFCNYFPNTPASLANSAGALLGKDFHFAMTRPGIALYGVHPSGYLDSPLQNALDWQARILQIRKAAAGERVGYGGTHQLDRDSHIATLGVGYADGYARQLGGMASVSIGGRAAPVVGRVSMDSITVDVTELNQKNLHTDNAHLIHEDYRLEHMASDLGTIAYEIMANLGHRAERHYHGGN